MRRSCQPVSDRGRRDAGLALEGGVADAGRLGALVCALLEHDRYRAAARRVADEIGGLPPVTDAVADLDALVGPANNGDVARPSAGARAA